MDGPAIPAQKRRSLRADIRLRKKCQAHSNQVSKGRLAPQAACRTFLSQRQILSLHNMKSLARERRGGRDGGGYLSIAFLVHPRQAVDNCRRLLGRVALRLLALAADLQRRRASDSHAFA